jgi:DUF971 family protein
MKEPDPKTKPLKIQRLPDNHTLRVEWADGHVCEITYDYLRSACPCASCNHSRQEADKGLRIISEEAPSTPLQIGEISLVGTYAVNLAWSDGHDTGIYTFRFLRDLCPHGGPGAAEATRMKTFDDF